MVKGLVMDTGVGLVGCAEFPLVIRELTDAELFAQEEQLLRAGFICPVLPLPLGSHREPQRQLQVA